MKFKKTEKEIIEAIVKYDGEVKSLAEVINKSQLLEKRGIIRVPNKNPNFIFLSKEKYAEDEKDALGYVVEMINLIESLIKNRLIVTIPFESSHVLAVGVEKSVYGPNLGLISLNDGEEYVQFLKENWADIISPTGQQTHWPITCTDEYVALDKILNSWVTVSQELKDLVENNFKTVEDIRFEKQQWLTWISIGVALIIGLLGIFCK